MNDTPIELGERRMLKGNDCALWSPQELLRALLRDIETTPVDGIVVCYFRRTDSGAITGMRRSKTTIMEAVAMIEMAKHDLLQVE